MSVIGNFYFFRNFILGLLGCVDYMRLVFYQCPLEALFVP